MNKPEAAQKILEYWYLEGMLSQPEFPAEGSREYRAGEGMAVSVCRALPRQGEMGKAAEDDAVQYQDFPVAGEEIAVCVGQISRDACLMELGSLSGQEKGDTESGGGMAALLGLKTDSRGRYVGQSLRLSPLAWGVVQLREAGGQADSLAVSMSLEKYERDVKNLELCIDGESVMTAQALRSLCLEAERRYPVPAGEAGHRENPEGVLVCRRYQTKEDMVQDREAFDAWDLSKSFLTGDLHLVYEELRDRLFGRRGVMEMAVLDYIIGAYGEAHIREGWLNFARRIDLRRFWGKGREKERADFFGRYLDIERAPMGKWPSKDMPSIMGQLGVNLSIDKEAEFGQIFTVNASAQEEKTAFLKDVIAGNVVERALLLVQYRDSDDAFTERHFEDAGEALPYYEFQDNRIKDYGMLAVASDSLAAGKMAEELTDADEVHRSLTAAGTETEEIARGLEHVDKLFDKWDAWGLFAADFETKAQLTAYAERTLSPYTELFSGDSGLEERKREYQKARRSFQNQYLRVENIKREISKVSGARARMQEEESKVLQEQKHLRQAMEEQRSHGEALQEEVRQLRLQVQQLTARIPGSEAKLEVLRSKCHKQGGRLQELEKEALELHQKTVELEKQRTLKDSLFTAMKKKTPLSQAIEEAYEKYHEKNEELRLQEEESQKAVARVEEQDQECRSLAKEKSSLNKKAALDLEEMKKTGTELARLDRSLQQTDKKIRELRQEYQQALIGAKQINNPSRKMQILDEEYWKQQFPGANPWLTEEYNRERERLFYYALQLHREFLLSSKSCFCNLKNLELLWGSGEFSPRDREDSFGTLFNTLFLMTPVIFTDSAAVGWLLRDMKKPGEIGYLLVTEAGSIRPQMALGALYRSRRAVAVGDFGQVKPEAGDAQEALHGLLRNAYSKPYESEENSVREFTDRMNPLGVYLTKEDKGPRVWTGCPIK